MSRLRTQIQSERGKKLIHECARCAYQRGCVSRGPRAGVRCIRDKRIRFVHSFRCTYCLHERDGSPFLLLSTARKPKTWWNYEISSQLFSRTDKINCLGPCRASSRWVLHGERCNDCLETKWPAGSVLRKLTLAMWTEICNPAGFLTFIVLDSLQQIESYFASYVMCPELQIL